MVTCILVAETFINCTVAFTPPSVTSVTPRKLVPLMVTVPPVDPYDGVKLVMVGGVKKLKELCEADPNSVVTATLPSLPVAAGMAVILVDE